MDYLCGELLRDCRAATRAPGAEVWAPKAGRQPGLSSEGMRYGFRGWVRGRRLARVSAAASVVVAVCLAMFRFVDYDAPVLYAVVPFAPAVAAIAGIGAACTFGRRAAAVVVAGVVVAVALVLPGPVVPRLGCDVQATRDDADIVLLSHNVELGANNGAEVAAQITAIDPDVVLLQESDEALVEKLLLSLDDTYPHVARSVGTGTTIIATLSRWPLADIVDTYDRDRPLNPFLITTVETPGGSVRVANVHLTAPIRGWLQERHEREYRDLMGPPYQTEVDVLMGDFNSSKTHVSHRRLLDTGFVDAHRQVGCGLGTTWSPLGMGGAVLPLDHMLTAPTARAESFQILDYAGSDHRAIVGSVTLTARSARAPTRPDPSQGG